MASAETAFPATDYERFRRAVEAAMYGVPPPVKAMMVAKYLGQITQSDVRKLAMRPAWLRSVLRQGGDALVIRMLRDNWEHTGSSAVVRETFGIPRSTLHRTKDEGLAIAYRPATHADFLFPMEQFVSGGVHGWARAIVKAVGNGAPALHFLYVRRKSLGSRSFAGGLRDRASADYEAVVNELLRTARRLQSE